MYKWNKELIKKQIDKLNNINNKDEKILYDIKILKELILDIDTENTIDSFLEEENDEYYEFKKYLILIEKVINKYKNYDIEALNYKKINSTYKETLDFTKYILNKINKEWYTTLKPIINDNNILKYQKNIENSICYISSIDKFYISLEKNNNIEDYLSPTHEYLHAYSIIKNQKFYYNIESEFLSLLGEMIIRYEMKKENFYKKEFIKSDINNLSIILDFIISLTYRTYVITNNIAPNNKLNYLYKKFHFSKQTLEFLYRYSLEYMYNYLISYFLAIELLEIYKSDKEKSIYMSNKILLDNNDLFTKLKTSNINLLEHDSHIKQLKKEYKIINNQ